MLSKNVKTPMTVVDAGKKNPATEMEAPITYLLWIFRELLV
jgi:hypothetical protein